MKATWQSVLLYKQNSDMAEEKKNYRKKQDSNTLKVEIGKVPPQSLELEEAVLGAIMVEKDAIIEVSDILKEECFYKDAHRTIYHAIIALSQKLEPIDLYTVTEQLRRTNELDDVGGAPYLAALTQKVGSAAHLEYHAKIIIQKYIQRELISASTNIQNKAFNDDEDVEELINFSEQQIFKIAEGNLKTDTMPISAIVKEAIKNIEESGKREDGLSGVPSGFTELDRLTSGWQKSDLIIVAARPSMGKTAFVLSMARNMAVEHNKAVAMFSLEMSNVQLVNRLLVSESEIPSEKIRNGKLSNDEWLQLHDKITNLSNAQIYIDDTPALSIFQFRAKCRRLREQHKIDIVIIDYLQLMTGPTETKGNRQEEVSMISRSLKAIAKELEIPIIALSQLSRAVETRGGNKRPVLSDLRESGAIEQDADIVMFIHRPDYYGLLEDENNNSTVGVAEIIVAKHRNGALEDVKLRFRKEFARFSDLDETFTGNISSTMSLPTPQVHTFGSRMNDEENLSNNHAGSVISSNNAFGTTSTTTTIIQQGTDNPDNPPF